MSQMQVREVLFGALQVAGTRPASVAIGVAGAKDAVPTRPPFLRGLRPPAGTLCKHCGIADELVFDVSNGAMTATLHFVCAEAYFARGS
jgi:hypothetical protein